MKTISVTQYGTLNEAVEMRDTVRPTIGLRDVLIKVEAASINPLDHLIRAGYLHEMMPMTFPYVMGSDAAGTVVEVGAEVTEFDTGDLIYVRPNFGQSGTFAEYLAVSADDVALKPKRLDFTASAALPQVALAALQALVLAGVSEGSRVLIHGGAGGVGSLAIQLAKQLGAKEIATTVAAEDMERVRQLGADQVIDFRAQDFAVILDNYDTVIDTQGGDVQRSSIDIVRKGGKVVTLNSVDHAEYAQEQGVELEMLVHQANGAQLKEIAEMVNQGRLKVHVDRVFPASQALEALSYSESGQSKGKVVLDISQF